MKLLLDQGLPRSTVPHLGRHGITVRHTAELGMSRANDEEIIEFARREEYVIVTLDADFHAILARSHATAPSVVRVRVEGLDGSRMAALLVDVLAACDSDLSAGAAVSVTTRRIRVRSLPVA